MSRRGWHSFVARVATALALSGLLLATGPESAAAVDIELKDVAPDRVERQRLHGYGHPMPGTPDLGALDDRLAAKGLAKGSPVFIRIFKVESDLELWIRKGDRFVLFETYPMCHWSGTLGPKVREGDNQSPEGVYAVTLREMQLRGKWRRAFNIGYPNPLDRLMSRTGSFILVHGGCSSIGCFAMTNPVVDEIYSLGEAALNAGQDRFQVHIFPFRMTAEAMATYGSSPWLPFWQNLKEIHDSFERTHIPPRVAMCGERYSAEDGRPGDAGDVNPFRVLARRSDTDSRCRFDGPPAGATATVALVPPPAAPATDAAAPAPLTLPAPAPAPAVSVGSTTPAAPAAAPDDDATTSPITTGTIHVTVTAPTPAPTVDPVPPASRVPARPMVKAADTPAPSVAPAPIRRPRAVSGARSDAPSDGMRSGDALSSVLKP